jgi:uncharacterized protein (TIGR04168 family)
MRFAVIGDIHTHFDAQDVRGLDESGYDLVLFVGDLAGYVDDGRGVARQIARMQTPAMVLPGNHDGVSLPHLAAEIFDWQAILGWLELDQGRRCAALSEALGPVPLVGYSLHDVTAGERAVTVIAARPHSFGGPRLGFRRHLRESYGVESLEDSAARLRRLVDAARHDDLVFLAHNGPTGLGDRRDCIWGCDFRREEGDFGDPDLREAIDHARATGRRVLAVVAGHMHHAIKGGGTRTWRVERESTLYVNAARVPRIDRHGRHHVAVTIHGDRAEAEAVVEAD